MADLYNVAAGAFQAGRARAQEQRLNQLAQLAMRNPSALPELAPQMAGVDATAGLSLSSAIQQRQLADVERERGRALGLARYLQQIPASAREGVAAAYRKRAPDLPMTLDDDSLGAYVSMAQASGMAGARVQSTKIGEDGQIYNVMSNGQIIPTGVMAENRQQVFKGVDEQGRPIFGAFDPRAGSVGGFGGGQQQMPPLTAQPPQASSIPTPGGRIDVADPAAMQFLRENPQVAAGLASGRPFDVPAQAPSRGGMMVGPDPVAQAGAIAGAQAQGRINAELAAAPAQAAVAANLERVRELAKGEAGRENDRLANRTGMIIALNQADQSTAAMDELVRTSIRPLVNGWTTGTFGSFLAAVPGSDAANLEANLDTLKAVAGFSELTALKARGGTLGAVSEMELQMLTSLWGALRQSQSPEAFNANLTRYMERVGQSWQNIANEYEARYGESAAGAVDNFRSGAAGALGGAQGQGRQVRRTGTLNGRRVVEYTDGSVEYGD